jgi:hypothetical protein
MGHAHELERLGGADRLTSLGVPWNPELRGDPTWALRSATRPVFLELREAERAHLDRGELRRHGLVAVDRRAPPEGPWLIGIREQVLDELGDSDDPQAGLVHRYFDVLWEGAP